jgi:hypothetical protein
MPTNILPVYFFYLRPKDDLASEPPSAVGDEDIPLESDTEEERNEEDEMLEWSGLRPGEKWDHAASSRRGTRGRGRGRGRGKRRGRGRRK